MSNRLETRASFSSVSRCTFWRRDRERWWSQQRATILTTTSSTTSFPDTAPRLSAVPFFCFCCFWCFCCFGFWIVLVRLAVRADGNSREQRTTAHRSKHSETEQRRRSKINERQALFYFLNLVCFLWFVRGSWKWLCWFASSWFWFACYVENIGPLLNWVFLFLFVVGGGGGITVNI